MEQLVFFNLLSDLSIGLEKKSATLSANQIKT